MYVYEIKRVYDTEKKKRQTIFFICMNLSFIYGCFLNISVTAKDEIKKKILFTV